MNLFETMPSLLEISRDPMTAPVVIAAAVVLAWTLVAMITSTSEAGEDARRQGWW